MRLTRVHVDGDLQSGRHLRLDGSAGNHIARVLRLRAGDALTLFNGQGGEYGGSIEEIRRDTVLVSVSEHRGIERESPFQLALTQGISRGERMDWVVQKATELGVWRIVPVFTERSVVHLDEKQASKKVQHWRSIAISACEQSGRNRIPEIAQPVELYALLERRTSAGATSGGTAASGLTPGGAALLLSPGAPLRLTDIPGGYSEATVLIGPEGGLADVEQEAAIKSGFTPVRLGPRVLRTETAAVCALTLLQHRFGIFDLMKYLVIALLALILGGLIGRAIWSQKKEQTVDPVQVIVTQLKTHAIVSHERQLAIWYRACPSVWGKTPQIFIAWPAKLTYELELSDVQVTRVGTVIKVRTAAIHPNEPAVPTDFMDYLSTTSILTFANEQELVNHEINKASPIARYLTSYFLARDPSLQSDFSDEVRRLVEHLAAALGVPAAKVEVDVPKPQVTWPKLPKLELCEGTYALANGLPFAKFDWGSTVPIGFRPPQPGRAGTPPTDNDAPKGIASVYGTGGAPKH